MLPILTLLQTNFINNTGRKRLITSITAHYDITKWIYLQGRIGYDNINDSRFKVTPTGTAYSSNAAGGLDEQSTAQQYELNYDALFGVKHDIVEKTCYHLILQVVVTSAKTAILIQA